MLMSLFAPVVLLFIDWVLEPNIYAPYHFVRVVLKLVVRLELLRAVSNETVVAGFT